MKIKTLEKFTPTRMAIIITATTTKKISSVGKDTDKLDSPRLHTRVSLLPLYSTGQEVTEPIQIQYTIQK